MTPQTSPLSDAEFARTVEVARQGEIIADKVAREYGWVSRIGEAQQMDRALVRAGYEAGAAAVPRGEPLTEAVIAEAWRSTLAVATVFGELSAATRKDIMAFARAIAARVGGGERVNVAKVDALLDAMHAESIDDARIRWESAERALAEAEKRRPVTINGKVACASCGELNGVEVRLHYTTPPAPEPPRVVRCVKCGLPEADELSMMHGDEGTCIRLLRQALATVGAP